MSLLFSKSALALGASCRLDNFQDVELMKEDLRKLRKKSQEKQHAHRLYKNTGWFQLIARNAWFENVTLGVIVLNAIWLAVDADYNDAAILSDSQPIFQIMEHAFCTAFTLEWLVRFFAYKHKCLGFTDRWFVFDTLLVLLMVLETWLMTIVLAFASGDRSSAGSGASGLRLVRLLRLLRMARMVRLLRAMPELLILIRGMAAATRSVCYTLVLLAILTYVFAIMFAQLTKDSQVGETHFTSVIEAMHTLLVYGTFLDSIGEILEELREDTWLLYFLFLAFVMLAALMVMNLLIGVLCEVVSAVSSSEKDAIMVDFVKEVLVRHVSAGDEDHDGMISKDEFITMVGSNNVVSALQGIGLDVIGLLDLVDDIFVDGASISIEDFMEIVQQFRGSQAAILKDIADLKRYIGSQFECITRRSGSNVSFQGSHLPRLDSENTGDMAEARHFADGEAQRLANELLKELGATSEEQGDEQPELIMQDNGLPNQVLTPVSLHQEGTGLPDQVLNEVSCHQAKGNGVAIRELARPHRSKVAPPASPPGMAVEAQMQLMMKMMSSLDTKLMKAVGSLSDRTERLEEAINSLSKTEAT
mmetsp:Transcript_79213/g.169687  ORF Transcript_79213/g.169687 Transcript_79213/m.169687 type:complete len:588 (+) Transcript_79213:119-1882(+)|eukprot:CAMPEP_0180424456 /NCGR_PEP_ID=MMETSP1036_2-20121128/4748_1 /TAXON_ID=632150 /ORGANISM="Azadinium spinosum, Strain 3D9" /LENGTH=587 /DNA_ID=CAMNT_0022429897 /DNA_START=133 /DNA_END=1896 /DNA_ORIENTATION=+